MTFKFNCDNEKHMENEIKGIRRNVKNKLKIRYF